MTALGHHLIIDLYGPSRTDDCDWVRAALEDSVEAIGATLLSLDIHPFGEGNGVSGAAILAESHMSFHAWPEHDYAALDAFVCGTLDPAACLPVLMHYFSPDRVETRLLERGVVKHPLPGLSSTKAPQDLKTSANNR